MAWNSNRGAGNLLEGQHRVTIIRSDGLEMRLISGSGYSTERPQFMYVRQTRFRDAQIDALFYFWELHLLQKPGILVKDRNGAKVPQTEIR